MVLKNYLKFFCSNFLLKIKYQCSFSDLIILATTAKSGTHYMKFLLYNYIRLLDDNKNYPATPNEMNTAMPNDWHKTYNKSCKIEIPSKLIKKYLGYFDITRTHIHYIDMMKNSKIIHIYRNPLDYCVSLYFYKYVNQNKENNLIKSPYDVFRFDFSNYMNTYISFRDLAKQKKNNLIRIRYENLVRNPELTLKILIRWLGVRVDNNLITKAIEYSSMDRLKELEKKELIHPKRKNLKQSFFKKWKNWRMERTFY